MFDRFIAIIQPTREPQAKQNSYLYDQATMAIFVM